MYIYILVLSVCWSPDWTLCDNKGLGDHTTPQKFQRNLSSQNCNFEVYLILGQTHQLWKVHEQSQKMSEILIHWPLATHHIAR